MKLAELSIVINLQIIIYLKKKKKDIDQMRINEFGDLIATSFQTQARVCWTDYLSFVLNRVFVSEYISLFLHIIADLL